MPSRPSHGCWAWLQMGNPHGTFLRTSPLLRGHLSVKQSASAYAPDVRRVAAGRCSAMGFGRAPSGGRRQHDGGGGACRHGVRMQLPRSHRQWARAHQKLPLSAVFTGPRDPRQDLSKRPMWGHVDGTVLPSRHCPRVPQGLSLPLSLAFCCTFPPLFLCPWPTIPHRHGVLHPFQRPPSAPLHPFPMPLSVPITLYKGEEVVQWWETLTLNRTEYWDRADGEGTQRMIHATPPPETALETGLGPVEVGSK